MVRSRGPTKYIIQSGVVGWSGGGGAGGAGGGDDDDGRSGDSVVRVPTALQALWLSEPVALTFQ